MTFYNKIRALASPKISCLSPGPAVPLICFICYDKAISVKNNNIVKTFLEAVKIYVEFYSILCIIKVAEII